MMFPTSLPPKPKPYRSMGFDPIISISQAVVPSSAPPKPNLGARCKLYHPKLVSQDPSKRIGTVNDSGGNI